jgi:hypothetical protein
MTNLGTPVSVKVQKVADIGALFSISSLFDNAIPHYPHYP